MEIYSDNKEYFSKRKIFSPIQWTQKSFSNQNFISFFFRCKMNVTSFRFGF